MKFTLCKLVTHKCVLWYTVNLELKCHIYLRSVFHPGLHYLLRQKRYSEKEIQVLLRHYDMWPLSIYTRDHLKFIVSNQNEESVSDKY